MQSYRLTDEFTDIEAEQALLASLMQSPGLYWDLLDLLTPEVFSQGLPTWQALALALETGQSPSIPADWLSTPDPHGTAQRLMDLHQRRLLAASQERLAQALFDETTPATDIVTLLEEETLRVQAALRHTTASGCSGPAPCCPRSWRTRKHGACSGRPLAAQCWACPRGWRSSITCWAASTRGCTYWLVPLAWVKPLWRCR